MHIQIWGYGLSRLEVPTQNQWRLHSANLLYKNWPIESQINHQCTEQEPSSEEEVTSLPKKAKNPTLGSFGNKASETQCVSLMVLIDSNELLTM